MFEHKNINKIYLIQIKKETNLKYISKLLINT